MVELDFLITAICFSFLGYGFCYMTLSGDLKAKTQNLKSKNPLQ